MDLISSNKHGLGCHDAAQVSTKAVGNFLFCLHGFMDLGLKKKSVCLCQNAIPGHWLDICRKVIQNTFPRFSNGETCYGKSYTLFFHKTKFLKTSNEQTMLRCGYTTLSEKSYFIT